MKKLLAKVALKKAIGLYVGEQQVTVSQIAGTPLGPVEIACQSESYVPEQLPDVISRLLSPLMGKRKRVQPVAIGIPAMRVFFSTRPIRNGNSETSPQVLLHEVLQSPNICIDDMVVEVIRAEPAKRKLASIVSCRKKYLAGLLETLTSCGIRPFRVEPAPCALLRLAARNRRPPRRSRTVLRILLGDRQALAVVTAGNLAVLWRYFNLPAEGETTSICSAVRSVQTLIGYCGIDSPLDVVMIHGRADLRVKIEAEEFRQQMQIPLVWSGGPELDDRATAYGLALGCLGQQPDEAFDISRSMKPRLSLLEIFPWGELAVQMALVICMALFLYSRSRSLDEALVPVRAETAQRAWLKSAQQPQLQKEQKDLEVRVEAIRKFVASRIIWTSYTHDIAARLPTTATLTMFYGLCELETQGKQGVIKPKKSFIVRASAPNPDDGSTPKEVDRFLTALRGHPLLQRDFPLVDLADIKFFQPNIKTPASSLFTVVCLPKTGNAPAKPAEGKGEAHAGKK